MTGPEHYQAAERLIERAGEWLDADTDWKASMSTEERLARKSADLAEAQAHATLALAAATALKAGFADESEASFGRTYMAWSNVAGPGSEQRP